MLEFTPLHVGQLPLAEYLRLKGGSEPEKNSAFTDKDGPSGTHWLLSWEPRNKQMSFRIGFRRRP